MRASFVSIANSVIRAAGYPEFARRISPQVSAGTTQALYLGAVGLYETFCTAGEFEVMESEGVVLTNRSMVTQPSTNKKVVTGAFLDIKAVNALCRAHGLLFKDRGTTSVQQHVRATQEGHQVPAQELLVGCLESGLTKVEVFEKASALADEVKSQEKVVKYALKLLDSDTTRSEFKDAQQTLRKHREELEPLEEALRLLRNEKYKYNKMHKAAVDSGSDVSL
ncbi:hypothetical protein EC968_003469 [Mortierella alpina]|nr:hypothetical protein EC968_003469 [Mortierella alpina]